MVLVEIAGAVLVMAAVTEALSSLVFSTLRRTRAAGGQALALQLFREQAQVLLDAARTERDRLQRSWQGARKFVVADKTEEAEGVFSFALVPHDQQPLPPFAPGQHVTVKLRLADHAKPVVRCYSLSDGPARLDRYRITVRRVCDGAGGRRGLASGHLCDEVAAGDIVDLLAPSGQFTLDPARATPVVLIGGGVGITPLLSMAKAIAAQGRPRETWLLLGMRNARYPLHAEVEELVRSIPGMRRELFLSAPSDASELAAEHHHQGHLDITAVRKLLPSSNYQFYLCGPPAMMESLTAGLREWGVPDAHLHFEAFGPASIATSHAPTGEVEPVEVLFARSGRSVSWTPEQGSLLDLAERSGVVLDSGCRAGSCGSCVSAVKEGEVEYSIAPGVPPAPGSCLTCIATPKGRVVLDA